MDAIPGQFVGLVAAVLASATVGVPFMRTTAARRVLRPFSSGPDGDDPFAAAAVYAGLSVAYAAIVVLAGESAGDAGAVGLTLTLLLPFGFGVAAATAWLPSVGVEWRPAGEARTDATLTFAAFLATLTATAAGGWLLVG
ncbi:hypothetical protein [Halobaculum gomorrense]|uniref:Uncharacterized protein n=1 Tax=Halobaculum gomorrense TaxID=43928 RepID=A0A1M5JZ87_9EURY|nr:hypothetical protein [Halobaculum gomorrense]SHG45610.1 hypothetical protein SAMN05443636_0313 [Halobaculum gomorrense]